MKRRPRIYYSDSQKALMWERWKQGATLHEIGKLFDRPHTSIHRILAQTGGFQPAERSRTSTALTLAEREEISRALVKGESIRSIARRLNRAPSTISREIKAMVAARTTVQARQTKRPGFVRDAPSVANCARTAPWPASWLASYGCSGHRSRSQAGSSILIRATKAITCHTRPSTAACSFKHVAP